MKTERERLLEEIAEEIEDDDNGEVRLTYRDMAEAALRVIERPGPIREKSGREWRTCTCSNTGYDSIHEEDCALA